MVCPVGLFCLALLAEAQLSVGLDSEGCRVDFIVRGEGAVCGRLVEWRAGVGEDSRGVAPIKQKPECYADECCMRTYTG